MALMTVQRSPSSSNSSSSNISEVGDETDDKRVRHPRLQRSFSQSFFAIKGAALILQGGENVERTTTKDPVVGDLQSHLQAMFMLLRPQDTVKLAVRLESKYPNRIRYLVVVSCTGRQDTQESVILGVDYKDKATIGLVLPIWRDTTINLDGDGGFTISSNQRTHIFKPVSVQALWSALQCLNKNAEIARINNYFSGGLHLTWSCYYESKTRSDQSCINEWNEMKDVESRRKETLPSLIDEQEAARKVTESLVKLKLREVMMKVDLDNITSKQVRLQMEEEMGISLREYRSFIDEEIIIILRQMDSASEIFEHVYLGSEWNASNLDELKQNGIGFILNLTIEIDNFYPGLFEYKNIRVYDCEETDLLKYWDDTFKFMDKARELGSKVLVHCKMGVSRSAATVMAYGMKEYGWSLKKTFQHVKERRSCVNPNAAFRKQLEEYEGILLASKQRHNQLWRSKSEADLESDKPNMEGEAPPSHDGFLTTDDIREMMMSPRPKSWSPDDNAAEHLMESMEGCSVEMPHESEAVDGAAETPMDQEDGWNQSAASDRDEVFETEVAKVRADESSDLHRSQEGKSSESKNLQLDLTGVKERPIMIVVTPTEEERPDTTLKDNAVLETVPEGDLELTTVRDTEPESLEKVSDKTDNLGQAEFTKPSVEPTIPEEEPGDGLNCIAAVVAGIGQEDVEASVEKADTEPVKELIKVEVQGTDSAGNLISEVAVIDKSSRTCVKWEMMREGSERDLGAGRDDGEGKEEQEEGGGESKEEGVDTYIKESIPWNPGTVLRQTQELEERLKSELLKQEARASRGSNESSKEGSGASSRASPSPHSSTEDLRQVGTGDGDSSPEQREDVPEDTVETDKKDDGVSEEEGVKDPIPEPGTVKRTMEIFHQIEKETKEALRERGSSYDKSVHSDGSARSSRSGSFEDVRPAGKVDSEGKLSEGEVEWENDGELSDRSEGEVHKEEPSVKPEEERNETKHVVIAGEEMQYEPGYVKRFKLDFEQKFARAMQKGKKFVDRERDGEVGSSSGSTAADKTSGVAEIAINDEPAKKVAESEKETLVDGELSPLEDKSEQQQVDTSDVTELKPEPKTEGPEQGTSESSSTVRTYYKEEVIDWPVGTVKQQREAIESKTSKDTTQSKELEELEHEWVKEGKLTVEELRTIRDLGKMILGREEERKEENHGKRKGSVDAKSEPGITQSCSDENLQTLAGAEAPANSVREKARQLELTGSFSQPELKRSASIAKMSDELVGTSLPEFPEQEDDGEGLELLGDSPAGSTAQQDGTVKGLVGIFNRHSASLDSDRKETAGSGSLGLADDSLRGDVASVNQDKFKTQPQSSESDSAPSVSKHGGNQTNTVDDSGVAAPSASSGAAGTPVVTATSVGTTALCCADKGAAAQSDCAPSGGAAAEAAFLKPKDPFSAEDESTAAGSRKTRAQHGKSHPLRKLSSHRGVNPQYNTM